MNVIIIRGLPGSGKSTLRQLLVDGTNFGATVCSADDFFAKGGKYKFDGSKLAAAHSYCQTLFVQALEEKARWVIVDNCNVKKAHYEFYEDVAVRCGYKVSVVTVKTTATDAELAARNKHGCPEATIRHMRERWED